MDTVCRIREHEPIPLSREVVRVLLTEEVPVGTGTATERVLTVVLRDNRFWLSDDEKRANP